MLLVYSCVVDLLIGIVLEWFFLIKTLLDIILL